MNLVKGCVQLLGVALKTTMWIFVTPFCVFGVCFLLFLFFALIMFRRTEEIRKLKEIIRPAVVKKKRKLHPVFDLKNE